MSEKYIAIDIGGSHAEYAVVRGDQILLKRSLPVSDASLPALLFRLEAEIPRLLADEGGEPRELSGVAICICGVVDKCGSLTATNGKYDDGLGFNLIDWAERCFHLPCRVENDARMALLGEHYAGAARGFEDAVMVTLGTGIGGAVMLGGKLLHSHGGKAGGLAGHLVVDWRGRACSCGNRGCAEAEASTASLPSLCRDHEAFPQSILAMSHGPIHFKRVFEAADLGDALAISVLDHCIGVWSALAVSLIHAYDPQVIVFGGGVAHRHADILPRIAEYVDRHAWVEKGSVRIVPSLLGSSAALLGAAPLFGGAA